MLANIQQWQIVGGFLVPIVVAALNRTEWPAGLKAACMLAVSAIVAGVGLYLQNALNAADLISSALTIAVATIAFYKGVWQPSGVTDLIEPNLNLLPAPSARAAARSSVTFVLALTVAALLAVLVAHAAVVGFASPMNLSWD